MTTAPATYPYLSYAPTSSHPNSCNDYFFDILGFKPATAFKQMRKTFNDDALAHVKSPSHKFLTSEANPKALKIIVLEFVAKYGRTYWGVGKRSHLQEPDALRGFLCPRDAQRLGSR